MRPSLHRDVTRRWLVVTDVSEQPIGPIFKGKAVQNLFAFIPSHVCTVPSNFWNNGHIFFHLSWNAWPLKKTPIGCPETSVATNQRCVISQKSEDLNKCPTLHTTHFRSFLKLEGYEVWYTTHLWVIASLNISVSKTQQKLSVNVCQVCLCSLVHNLAPCLCS